MSTTVKSFLQALASPCRSSPLRPVKKAWNFPPEQILKLSDHERQYDFCEYDDAQLCLHISCSCINILSAESLVLLGKENSCKETRNCVAHRSKSERSDWLRIATISLPGRIGSFKYTFIWLEEWQCATLRLYLYDKECFTSIRKHLRLSSHPTPPTPTFLYLDDATHNNVYCRLSSSSSIPSRYKITTHTIKSPPLLRPKIVQRHYPKNYKT